jgi:hypothetical protein
MDGSFLFWDAWVRRVRHLKFKPDLLQRGRRVLSTRAEHATTIPLLERIERRALMFRLFLARHRKSSGARRMVVALVAVALLLVAGGGLRGVRPAFASGCCAYIYVHTTTSTNTFGDLTLLDNPNTNNNPSALVYITANWDPGGIYTNFDDHQTGVWYDAGVGQWSIFNEDLANMPIGASFNVYTVSGPDGGGGSFVHTVTSTGTHTLAGYITLLNNPWLNGNPNANFLVTQNWNPGGSGEVYNNHAIGVWYSALYGEWTIYNEDRASIPIGASFNVINETGVTDAFTQVATNSNTTGDSTCMNDSLLNGNPNALAFMVHTYGASGPYMTDVTAVWYSSLMGKWCIFDGSYNAMPLGNSFLVTASTRYP